MSAYLVTGTLAILKKDQFEIPLAILQQSRGLLLYQAELFYNNIVRKHLSSSFPRTHNGELI